MEYCKIVRIVRAFGNSSKDDIAEAYTYKLRNKNESVSIIIRIHVPDEKKEEEEEETNTCILVSSIFLASVTRVDNDTART